MDSRVGDSFGADSSAVGLFPMSGPGFYTGVGSRETPVPIQREFTAIAGRLASAGWVLRSGAARGGDVGFERGVRDPRLKEIYLPFEGFRGGALREGGPQEARSASEPGVYLATPELATSAAVMARAVHPNWNAVLRSAREGSPFALHAHTRNPFQVLGRDLAMPSMFAVLWAPAKGETVTGGTATAFELARRNGIPVYNFALPEQRLAFYVLLDRIVPEQPEADTTASPGRAALAAATVARNASAVAETEPRSTTALTTTTTRTSATMSTTDTEQRFQTIKDPDTRLIASEIGRFGGVFSRENAEWVFPGSDYISRNLEHKTSTGASDKADALVVLYHATRPTPEQMQQLQQMVNTLPFEILGIRSPRGSVKAKKEIAGLLNPNTVSRTRVEYIVSRAVPYMTPASEKAIETVNTLIANGYDIIAWGFDAKAEAQKVWAYDGAPKGVGPTVGRARELMAKATPYVEADRRRQRAEAERALLTGDLEHSNGAINYAQVDVANSDQLNVLRRVEAEGRVSEKRLGDLDNVREHRAEQAVRRDHNERTTDEDSRDVQRARGFDGSVGKTPLEKARADMDYVLREYLEASTPFKGSDIVVREPRPGSKLSGTVVQFIKVDDGSEGHFLAAVQHAGAKIETPSHFAIHGINGDLSIAYNLSSKDLRALQSSDEVFKVVGPVTYADAVEYGQKNGLALASEPEHKRGPITEKPSRTFTILDSRTFDRPVETGAPVRLQFGEPEPSHFIVLDMQQRYSIVTDRDEQTLVRFSHDTLKKVAGPYTLERAKAYADTNKLEIVARPPEEVAPIPAGVAFAGIGSKTRNEILGLDPEVMRSTWGFSPVQHEHPAGASVPTRLAVNPPERPDFWQTTSRDEAHDLIRSAADVDPMVQARDDAKHLLEQRALAAGGGETARVARAAEIELPRREDKTVDATVLFQRDGIVALDRGFNRFSVVRESEIRGKIPEAGKPIKIQGHADKAGFDVSSPKPTRRVAKT